jgi:hypothetical protein
MNGMIYDRLTLRVTQDRDKNLFIIPRDSVNYMYDKLEPYCRKKRINLSGVPDFVYKIIENPQYKVKVKRGEKPAIRASPAKFSTAIKLSQTSDVQEDNQK